MTTKTITTTYNNGYTLAAKYSSLYISTAGFVTQVATVTGQAGATALSVPNTATFNNHGKVTGGKGGLGDLATKYVGGEGGIGVNIAGGEINNHGSLTGGQGGVGGFTAHAQEISYENYAYYAGNGGKGGTAARAGADVYVNNYTTIKGGVGGTGAASKELEGAYYWYGAHGGVGGNGGIGLSFTAGGTVNNIGLIAGGQGGIGGFAPDYVQSGTTITGVGGDGGTGGVGIYMDGAGVVINYTSILGGAGGAGGTAGSGGATGNVGAVGEAIYMYSGGTVINGSYDDAGAVIRGSAGIYFGVLSSATVINYGLIASTFGAPGPALQFGGGESRLVVEPGSGIVGYVTGSNAATLEFTGPRAGDTTATMIWTSPGQMTVTTPTSTNEFIRFGTLQIDGTMEMTLSGSGTIAPSYGVILRGVLDATGALTNQAASMTANEGFIDIYGGTLAPKSLINSGLISGYGAITGPIYEDGGTFEATTSGKTLSLQGGTITNIHGGFLAALPGAVLQLTNNLNLSSLGITDALVGAGAEIQEFNTSTASEVTLDDALTTITSTGTLDILGGRNFDASNAIMDSGTIQLGAGFIGNGTISGGALTIEAGGSLIGFGEVDSALTVLATGLVDATSVSLLLDPSTHTIVNQGELEANQYGGLIISGAAVNNAIGTIVADADGVITLDGSSIYGGSLSIAATGALYAASGANTLAMSGGVITNAGEIHTAGGGAGLTIGHAHVSNAGGTVLAAAGSVIGLYDAAIYGGAITISAGATMIATGSANALSLAGGTISNAGEIETSGGGALTIVGDAVANAGGVILVGAGPGHLLLSNGVIEGGAITIAAGGALDSHYASNTLAMAGGTITNGGTLDTLSGAHLTISNATLNNAGGTLIAEGTGDVITLTSTTINGVGLIAGYAGSSLSSNGTILGAGTIYGAMSITNSGTIDDNAGALLINNLNGGGLANSGLIESTGAGALTLKEVTVSGSGSIEAFGTIKLDASDITGGTVNVETGGVLQVASTISSVGSGVTVDDAGSIRITSGAYLYLSSNIIGAGSIAIDGVTGTNADLKAVGNVTLSGGGQVSMNVNGFITGYGSSHLTNADTITGGGAIFGSMTVTNSGVIDDDAGAMLINNESGGGLINNGLIESTSAGILSLKDVTVTGTGSITDDHQMKLDDAAINGGTITVGAAALFEVIAGTSSLGSAVTLTNDKTLEVINGGKLTIAGAVTNNGLMETTGTGALILKGAITGSGSARLTGSGSLTIDGADSQGVTFASTDTGNLVLGSTSAFTGAISGLSKSEANAIDLQGVTYNASDTAKFSGTSTGGTLTILSSTNAVLATLTLKGNYMTATWQLSNDGSGDVLVKDQPASGPLAHAIASFAPAASSGVQATSSPAALQPLPLAVRG